MSVTTSPPAPTALPDDAGPAHVADSLLRRVLRSKRVLIGGGILALILLACVLTLPKTLNENSPLFYDNQTDFEPLAPPARHWAQLFGTDDLGRPIFARCLIGGSISILVGLAAATISVVLGVTVGLFAGFRGGLTDALLMRFVDVMYGLPYILLIILFKVAFEKPLTALFHGPQLANLTVLFASIGLVSWLTMARVVRGQVLSLRAQPFIEAARALGLPARRIFLQHILPNLIGPITVYATLTIPQAILQESFLSFLGVGIKAPLPTWGSLAAEGLILALNPLNSRWWTLLFPCLLLVTTLLSLNFLGDGLRDVFDPKREAAKL